MAHSFCPRHGLREHLEHHEQWVPYLVRFENLTSPNVKTLALEQRASPMTAESSGTRHSLPRQRNADQVICDWYKKPKSHVETWSGGEMTSPKKNAKPGEKQNATLRSISTDDLDDRVLHRI